jgi:putative ubiquitin-RnfH superfamily antitoxin RatB of RatAB toxin-antitoxin module
MADTARAIGIAWTEAGNAREYWFDAGRLSPGITYRDLLEHPEIRSVVPQGLRDRCGLAVFGKRRHWDDVVEPGDRVELLAPLVADPKLARQGRVERERLARAHGKWHPDRG